MKRRTLFCVVKEKREGKKGMSALKNLDSRKKGVGRSPNSDSGGKKRKREKKRRLQIDFTREKRRNPPGKSRRRKKRRSLS